ncbi:MAG: type II toxin-antitoxin system HicA family toxin [Desulfovibrionales bacterium]|nr:type II toxin-antitoxin system HicA family toxin [Desulfovibrionales bacterium]
MPKLPIISGKEMVRALEKYGFHVVRRKGSHISLQKEAYKTVVPLHDELAKGTILGILKQCGLRKEDLLGLIKKQRG